MTKEKNLKQKAASSMVWTALQKYSTMGIKFISGIILARLLTPFDYGCIGMLSIFMVLAEAFIDSGFGSALIQKKQPTQEDYSTIFWWNLGMALLLYAALYISAPAIARFYEIPLLCDVLRVQGIILLIYAFNVVQRNQLRKKLKFKVLSVITIITSITALMITIFMAYHGFGVWALVAQNIINSAIPALAFWFYVKWKPVFVFSKKSFKELFDFGIYMFLTHLANSIGQQIQGLLIGKTYNPATMGYYAKAHGTEVLASTSISSVMTQVTFPLYAEAQDNPKVLGNMVKRITMTLSYITMPLMFILILLAKPVFILLYSDRWLASVPYFQMLCIAGLANCLMAVNAQTIAAIGKSRIMFQWTLVKRTVGIAAIVLGLMLWGMHGLLAGIIINSYFSYFVNICLVSKHVGYKWFQQLKDLMPVLAICILAAIISYGCSSFFHLGLYSDGIFKAFAFLGVYLGWSLVFKPEAYTYTLSIIPAKLKFRGKR